MSHESNSQALQDLIDFHQVSQVMYRYASTVDAKDWSMLRTLFVEDATAKYGDYPELVGVDAILDFITTASEPREWLHHLLSVYHVDVDRDEAAALTYHTSHQIEPGGTVVGLIVARYRDRLRRVDGEWKIVRKEMEIGWREKRSEAGTPGDTSPR
jgi:3-phenylpropionate/cinnamic acid dioxygenase small subunit